MKDKDVVLKSLSKTHEIVEFSNEEMSHFCGNALEVIGRKGEKMLTMSKQGYGALSTENKKAIDRAYPTVITPDIPTIEYYGGGSARCMMLEMF